MTDERADYEAWMQTKGIWWWLSTPSGKQTLEAYERGREDQRRADEALLRECLEVLFAGMDWPGWGQSPSKLEKRVRARLGLDTAPPEGVGSG